MEAEGEAARVEGAPPAALVGEKRKADDTPNASDVDAAASPPVKALAVQTAKSGSEQYPIASFSLSAPGARTSNGRSMPSFPRKLHQTTLPFAPSPDRRPKDTAPPCSPSSPASDKATPPPLLRDATQILEPDLPVDPAPPPHVPLQPPVVLTPPEPKPKWKGLDNYGNTCYVNVIVQALFFCPGFREALSRFVNATEDMLAGETEQNIRRRPPRGMQLMGSLNSLLQCMDPDVGPPSLTPQLSNFLKEMRSVDKRFQGTRQQDAQEFLNFMLLTLHAVATEFSKPPPPPSATRRLASLSDSDTSLDENTSTPSETQTAPAATPQRSFISDMFEGKLEMRIKCLECECASSKPEPFMDLSLSLLGNRSARTLEELLQDFFHTEKLNGSDKFFCDNCHAKTEARKGYVFASLPPILTLHLKRFSYDHRKICTHLRPPFETTFSNYCRDPGPMLVYRLYAVVFHAGYYANSGHYKCVVRRDKQWLGFDDDEVTALSESEISSLFPEDGEGSSTAYILFYHLYDPTQDNAAAVSAAELLSSLAPGSVVMAEPHHGDEAHVQSLLNELHAEESAAATATAASNRPPAAAANRTALPPPLPSVPEPPPPDLSLPATLDPDAPVDLPPLPRLPSQTDALMRDVSDVMDTSSVRTHATQDSTSDRMQL